MDEKTRLRARELLLRSRIYRFTALVFAICGGIVFMVLYFKYMKDGILAAFQDIKLVVILLFPFLPASVMSWLAVKTENNLKKILSQTDGDMPKAKGGK